MRRFPVRFALVVASVFLVDGPSVARAQVAAAGGFDAYSTMIAGSGSQPRFVPRGEWVEVITATPRWIVVQNRAGQQFPIATNAISLFVMRWPTTLNAIPVGAQAEVVGLAVASNRVQAPSVDVFVGPAARLAPSRFDTLFGYNRQLTMLDVEMMNTYGLMPTLLPGEDREPTRLHVAGPVIGFSPLTIGVAGNNGVSVMLPQDGMLYQVTLGDPARVTPGDTAYVVPAQVSARSIIASQVVVYKKVPLEGGVR